jgi:serine phosphatase RsbU (regulator of sigma subunit)
MPPEAFEHRPTEPLGQFLDAAHEVAPHDLPALVAAAASQLGAERSRLWLVDHQMQELVALELDRPEERIPVEGTMAGRTFISSETVVVDRDADGSHLWLPLLDGVDRVGVLELETRELSPARSEAFRYLASLAASEIVTRGQYTDLFTCIRRRRPMSLAAEMQWGLLPPNSFTAREIMVAAHLEPAYEVGGDCYDYAHGIDRLDLAILDAVGHDLASTTVSSLALGAYRNARRSGDDLFEIAGVLDRVILGQLGDGRFATGQLAVLDTSSGVLSWINAGHPLPLLVRGGQVIGSLSCAPRPPFGLGHLQTAAPPELGHDQLEPGDGVLFYTDGVVESRRPGAEDYGLHRLEDFLHTAHASGLSPAETVRRLSNAILDFHDDDPRDDASILFVVWRSDR